MTYDINDAARVIQKSAVAMMPPESAAIKLPLAETRLVKNPITSKTRASR